MPKNQDKNLIHVVLHYKYKHIVATIQKKKKQGKHLSQTFLLCSSAPAPVTVSLADSTFSASLAAKESPVSRFSYVRGTCVIFTSSFCGSSSSCPADFL
uniref:Uncharacterized protein n=1 Tax=Solanum tuberosum TaxID=4113 RepID=M1ADL3_SOLTU